jgi:alkylhydroperoxidase family enzyme
MARISLDPPQSFAYRIGQWFLRRRFGEVLDPFRAQAHNVPVAQAFGRLEQSAAKWNRLDRKIRDLADMTAAVKIGCAWCMDFGYWMMHTHGIPREKMEAIAHWRDSKLFSPLERLVMEYAEAMTESPPTVDDALVERLRIHLDEAQLVELTATGEPALAHELSLWADPPRVQGPMRDSAAGRTPLRASESCPIRLSHSLVTFRHGSNESNRFDQEFGSSGKRLGSPRSPALPKGQGGSGYERRQQIVIASRPTPAADWRGSLAASLD